MTQDITIHPLSGIDARIAPYDWAFARDGREQVMAHWARLTADKPRMFNGQVLLQHEGTIRDGVFRARYFQTDYASFLVWKQLGCPGAPLRNGFAMAALQAADGAFLLGRMGAHTANGGMVYFAAGTPDLDDLRPDGTVDLAGSVSRELAEETGLAADEFTAHDQWHVVFATGRAAFMRKVTLPWPADEAQRLIRGRLGTHTDGELDDMVIVRRHDDIDPATMPPFQRAYLAHMLSP